MANINPEDFGAVKTGGVNPADFGATPTAKMDNSVPDIGQIHAERAAYEKEQAAKPWYQKGAESAWEGVKEAWRLSEGLPVEAGPSAVAHGFQSATPYIAKGLTSIEDLAKSKAIPKAAEAVEKVASIPKKAVEPFVPGATKRAQSLVEKIATPSDKSELGAKMNQELTQVLSSSQKGRSSQALKDYQNYYKQGRGKEGEILQRYGTYIMDQATRKGRSLSPSEKKLLKDSVNRLGQNPDIEAIEKELRYLRNIQNYPKAMEGAEAIPRLKAQQMADTLETVIERVVPKSKTARDNYEKYSEVPNLFDTIYGRKAVGEEIDPRKLPDYFFKGKFGIEKLKQLAGNEQKVNEWASEHAATELRDLNAEDATKWIEANNEWLKYLPSVEKEVTKYVDNLNRIQKAQKIGKGVAKGAAYVGGASYGFNTLKNAFGL
jgi:hypothetical protein